MASRANIALSYLAMLSVAGFLFWIVGSYIRSLRTGPTASPPMPAEGEPVDAGRARVDWPIHLFPTRSDDIPIPGRLVQVGAADAFIECSVRLETGQEVSLYVAAPDREPVRLSVRVTWARTGRGGRSVAQVAFDREGGARVRELLAAR